MKVVILAGGLGTRMREETEFRPKPMVLIGGKPVLWHIMKLYSHFGFNDFVVATGYKSELIKSYFMNFQAENYDFTVELGKENKITFYENADTSDWTVTVADTGLHTPTGGRINKVRRYLEDKPFLCTYGDGLAPVNISELLSSHSKSGKVATVSVAQPASRFGTVKTHVDGTVKSFHEKPHLESLVSIGYFVMSPKIFDWLDDSSILEQGPLSALASMGELGSFPHQGFWEPMDTYREALRLNELWDSGQAPWKIWS